MTKYWRDQYPDLVSFLKGEVRSAVDLTGDVYYNALDRSFDEYGYEGLSMQLLYVSNNLKPGHRLVSKQLVKWSKRIDKEQGV